MGTKAACVCPPVLLCVFLSPSSRQLALFVGIGEPRGVGSPEVVFVLGSEKVFSFWRSAFLCFGDLCLIIWVPTTSFWTCEPDTAPGLGFEPGSGPVACPVEAAEGLEAASSKGGLSFNTAMLDKWGYCNWRDLFLAGLFWLNFEMTKFTKRLTLPTSLWLCVGKLQPWSSSFVSTVMFPVVLCFVIFQNKSTSAIELGQACDMLTLHFFMFLSQGLQLYSSRSG